MKRMWLILLVLMVGCKTAPTFTGGYRLEDGSMVFFWSDGTVTPLTPEEVERIKDDNLASLRGIDLTNLPRPQKDRVQQFIEDINSTVKRQMAPSLQAKNVEVLIKEAEQVRDQAVSALQKVEGDVAGALNGISDQHKDNIDKLRTYVAEAQQAVDAASKLPQDLTMAEEATLKVQTAVASLQQKLEETTRLESQVNELLGQHAGLESKINDLQNRNSQMDTRLAELRKQNEALSQNLEINKPAPPTDEQLRNPFRLDPRHNPFLRPPQPEPQPEPAPLVTPSSLAKEVAEPAPPVESSDGLDPIRQLLGRMGGGINAIIVPTPYGTRVELNGTLDVACFATVYRIGQGDPPSFIRVAQDLMQRGPQDVYTVQSRPCDNQPNKVHLTVTASRASGWPRQVQQKEAEVAQMLGELIALIKSMVS